MTIPFQTTIFLLSLLTCTPTLASSRPLLSLFFRSAPTPGSVWSEVEDPEGSRAHELMSQWLEKFYALAPPSTLLAPPPPLLPRVKSREDHDQDFPLRIPFTQQESQQDLLIYRNRNTTSIGSAPTTKKHQRRYLIVAPVGTAFNASSSWMTHPHLATYHILALYYGTSPNFTCPFCIAVHRIAGPKWGLLRHSMHYHPDFWTQALAAYSAIMVPDDDLSFGDTRSINRMFELFTAYDLVLGQPSVCRTPYRSTYWTHLYQDPRAAAATSNTTTSIVLRYVTFVEIMTPIFEIDFFKHVVTPSLWNAHTGWGLDFIWPYLLRYPTNKIAVLDEVCVTHTNAAGQRSDGDEGNLYQIPRAYSQQEEEGRRAAEYGYWPSRVQAMGFEYRGMEQLGSVVAPTTLPRGGEEAYDALPPMQYGYRYVGYGGSTASRQGKMVLGGLFLLFGGWGLTAVASRIKRGRPQHIGARNPKY